MCSFVGCRCIRTLLGRFSLLAVCPERRNNFSGLVAQQKEQAEAPRHCVAHQRLPPCRCCDTLARRPCLLHTSMWSSFSNPRHGGRRNSNEVNQAYRSGCFSRLHGWVCSRLKEGLLLGSFRFWGVFSSDRKGRQAQEMVSSMTKSTMMGNSHDTPGAHLINLWFTDKGPFKNVFLFLAHPEGQCTLVVRMSGKG